MIQILHNSKSDNYIKLKEKFTGNYFPWYFNNNVAREEFNTEDNVFYFGHTLYTRPEVSGFSQPASENFQLAFTTMQEILTENNYDSSKYFLLSNVFINVILLFTPSKSLNAWRINLKLIPIL